MMCCLPTFLPLVLSSQAEEREAEVQQGRLLDAPRDRADSSDPAHPSTPPQVHI